MDRRQRWANAVGQTVRALRERQGLSQEAFAENCGLHRTFVSLLERGMRLPALDSLEKLASGLQIKTSDLVRLAEKRIR